MSAIVRASSVANIVTEHPECARVFTEYDIDFCCHGDVPLDAACAAKNLDLEEILARLRAAAAASPPNDSPASALSTPELVAHLVARHHAYLRKALPAIEPLVARVARVHGTHNPKLAALLEEVSELRAELEPHLDDEESEIFPLLMSRDSDADQIARKLAEVREEHERVGRSLARIRQLCDDFSVPEWACGSYRMMVSELAALEEDTLRHVHLENHVLMPRFARRSSHGGNGRARPAAT